MMTPQEDTHLARCRRLIEEKVGWGSSKDWSTQDFEQLGEKIIQHTGIKLSVTTLKRIWGRVNYNSAPTLTTLNALATFVGYENWRDFQGSQENQSPAIPSTEAFTPTEGASPAKPDLLAPGPQHRSSNRRQWMMVAGLVVGLVAVLVFFQNYSSPKPLTSTDFSFSSQPVTKGLPNSVVFHYDATRASSTDSIFIQQSWDPSRRQWVQREGHEHTSIYYYPGYYRAKLVVGKQVVREHDLIIPSDGWVATVYQEPVPVYFKPDEVIRNGVLHLPISAIQQQNISMQPKAPLVHYGNVLASTGLMSDNFVFDTRVKVDFSQGSAACQNMALTILCKNDIFSFPLCAKGCVGQLGLYLGGQSAVSTDTDLSGFGCDLTQWVDVRCKVQNKRVLLFVDGKKAYETTFPNEPAEIIGISYQFEGTGSVDFVRLAQLNGEMVFEDNFDSSSTSEP